MAEEGGASALRLLAEPGRRGDWGYQAVLFWGLLRVEEYIHYWPVGTGKVLQVEHTARLQHILCKTAGQCKPSRLVPASASMSTPRQLLLLLLLLLLHGPGRNLEHPFGEPNAAHGVITS
jgi:hypothetical protein